MRRHSPTHRGTARRPPANRGAIATALVLAIVLLGVAVTAATVAAGSGLGLASLRTENLRAVAACDSGMQLALAEIASGLDTDGDGTIGGVSDNGLNADDPTLDGASVVVEYEDGLLTAVATCGAVTRTRYIEIEMDDPGSPSPAPPGAGGGTAKGTGKAKGKSSDKGKGKKKGKGKGKGKGK